MDRAYNYKGLVLLPLFFLMSLQIYSQVDTKGGVLFVEAKYEEKTGERDRIKEAYKLYLEASMYGHSEAMCAIGRFYENGIVVKQDYKEAVKWYTKAIEKGSMEACCNLGEMHFMGRGVDKDLDKTLNIIDKVLQRSSNAPEHYSPYHNMALDLKGRVYIEKGNIKMAEIVWSKIDRKDTDYIYNKNTSFYLYMRDWISKKEYNNIAKLEENKRLNLKSELDVDIPEANDVNNYSFVVIVANENYKRESKVPFALNDGEGFFTYCKKTLGIPDKNIHFISNATLNDIKYNINWLKQVMEVYEGDAKAIFYYAGHGIPDESQKTAYLLPVDGYGSDVTTGYNVDELYTTLGRFPSKGITVFLDACFSGAKREGDMLTSARGIAIKVKKSNPTGNMVVFSAAQSDETAYSYDEQQHGMFTYYLLKKLQETKGDATLGEISDYVTSEVRKQSIVINGKMQTPTLTSSSAVGDAWRNWKLK